MSPSRSTWLGWAALVLAGVLLVIAFAVPAKAAAVCPDTRKMDAVVGSVIKNRGQLIDVINVHGIGYDQLLIVEINDTLTVALFLRGCSMSPAIPLGKMEPSTPA